MIDNHSPPAPSSNTRSLPDRLERILCDPYVANRAMAATIREALEVIRAHETSERQTDEELLRIYESYGLYRGSHGSYQQDILRMLRHVAGLRSAEETSDRREYHANGTYWSGVPTVAMPCDFCHQGIEAHDPRTHACPPEKACPNCTKPLDAYHRCSNCGYDEGRPLKATEKRACEYGCLFHDDGSPMTVDPQCPRHGTDEDPAVYGYHR